MKKLISMICVMALLSGGMPGIVMSETNARDIGVYNDWGKLREVVIGIEDETVEPEWVPALGFLSKEAQEDTKKYGGKRTADVLPETVKEIRREIEGLVKTLEERGVIVHRTKPMRYKEELTYLDSVQKGNHSFGGEDYFRVFANKVVLINALRLPFRRKHVYYVRPALEPLLEGTNAVYVAMPPPSPHYDDNDLFLEAGDILMDGFDIYVGLSGKGSSKKGIEWLQQYLGPEYKVWTVEVDPGILHLDCVMTLIKPGLLVYYPDLVGELPEPLKNWDKIELYKKEGEEEPFGANNLSLDENTIIVPDRYPELARELKKRGMEVITLPFDMTIAYGAGPRCLTAVLKRDR
jgi:N-dimethylarginine dimethylaminohydrolase